MSTFPAAIIYVQGLYIAVNVAFIVRIFFALRGPGIPWAARIGICLLAVALSLTFPIARGLDGNEPWIREITVVGFFWFAFMYHALLAWALLTVFRLFNWRFRWLVIAKEDRVRWRHRSCAGIAAASLVMCAAGWINSQFPVVREVKLPAPEGVAPLRIVALSDLHLGRLASTRFFFDVVRRVEPLSPDIVLFLGDILEHDYDPFVTPVMATILQQLEPRLGIWGVMGNHEYIKGRGELNREVLNEMGIRTLIDQWALLGEKPGEKILLIGRRDRSMGRKHISDVIANVPEKDRDALKILLDHQPDLNWGALKVLPDAPPNLKRAEDEGIYLQLSGHTHRGQFFPVNFIVSILFENAYGYEKRGQTHFWATSGVGAWGPRVRLTGRPEILMIDLVPQPGAQLQTQ